jgi:hypothetical protein
MPYRADQEALRDRHAAVARRLAEIQAEIRDIAELEREEKKLRAELAQVLALLAGHASKRSEGVRLEDVRIASPCSANWGEMTGDERVRFCGKCEKNVYNLSAMSRDEAEALLQKSEGRLCVRFYQRADGTVMTSDCSIGVRRKRVRRLAVLAAGVGAAGALASMTAERPEMRQMGAVARMGDSAPMGSVAFPDPPAMLDPPPRPQKIMGRAVNPSGVRPSPVPTAKGPRDHGSVLTGVLDLRTE